MIKQQELHAPDIDHMSHFILRLSYCQTEELRRWFIQQECALFHHRLLALSQEQLTRSVQSYAKLSPISKQEKEALLPLLKQLYNPTEVATMALFAVPFTQALDLVAKRQAILQRGRVYVPHSKLYSILVARFRSDLSKQLVLLSHVSTATEDLRVGSFVKNVAHSLTQPSKDFQNSTSTINASNVASMQSHMPLCMQQLQTGLERDKHLRHWGRLQYGLFLKGAGLSMDDALQFFQKHFTKVTGEEFQKQYAYNIRHMYGKEGKRATYPPFGCTKIIMGNAAPAAGEHHGCPYRHYDADHLTRTLQKLNIGTPQDRSAILRLKKEGNFQLACQKQFDVQHPKAVEKIPLDDVGNHPNAWFRASVAYHTTGTAGTTNTIGSTQGGGTSLSNTAEETKSSSLAATGMEAADVDDVAAVEVSPEK